MYDYVDGKVDWMAYGLPVEGQDGPFLGEQAAEVPTCDAGLTVADARRVMDETSAEELVVINADRLALGSVGSEEVEGVPEATSLLDVMRPVPSTARPSVTVASVAGAGGGERLVTTSDGRLVGRAAVAGNHDHRHHHQEVSIDAERYEEELASVMKAVEERFKDGEPSAEELRAFLRDRLVAEGQSEEEAESFLSDMTES